MKTTHQRAARRGVAGERDTGRWEKRPAVEPGSREDKEWRRLRAVVILESRAGRGPWAGRVDPRRGTTCVRRCMKWYRQRLRLSLHVVEDLTGIDRAYLRRLERRRINLSVEILWRWCDGMQVNIEWVMKMAHLQGLELPASAKGKPSAEGGGRAAPCSTPPVMAECTHACAESHPLPAAAAPSGPAGDPEDLHWAHAQPECRGDGLRWLLGLESLALACRAGVEALEEFLPQESLLALVA